jgi:hypothetical protein
MRRIRVVRGFASHREKLFLVAILGGICSFCSAREYHLDSSGKTGGDGSIHRPWRSLESLSNVVLQPGDKVLFARGSRFVGAMAVKQSGTVAAPILISNYGSGKLPKFTNPDSVRGNAIYVDRSHVIVDGLFFENCPGNPVATDIHFLGAVFLSTNATHCTVRNCEMARTPIGITVYGEHNLVTENYIHDDNAPIQPHWGPIGIVICGSHNEVSYNRIVNYAAPSAEYGHDGGAIEINDRSLPKEDILVHHNLSLRNQGFIEFVGRVKQDNFQIHHNVCMDYQSFIGLTGPCTNFRIENNTVVRTLAHPRDDSEDVVFWSYFGGNTNINLLNNIFVYDCRRIEPVFSRGDFRHGYNLFYRTDETSIRKQPSPTAYERKYLGGGAQLRQGDKIGNPLFANLAHYDFRLKAGSPAIGAGTNLGYTVDFGGHRIPTNEAPDMGAFQHLP